MTSEQVSGVALAQAPRRGVANSGAPRTKENRTSRLILILDYEMQQAERLRRDLMSVGYEVDTVAKDADAERRLCKIAPDLMLLDFELRDLSGDLARLRGYADRGVPIIALVARESDGLRLLFAGADDFLVKPVSSIHLLARVQSLLRRTKPKGSGSVLRVGDIELDPDCRRASCAGQTFHLGPTEFRILRLMMESPGQVFSRKELLANVWGRWTKIDTRAVDVYMSRLRRAVNRAARMDAFMTVRGLGYALKADQNSRKTKTKTR